MSRKNIQNRIDGYKKYLEGTTIKERIMDEETIESMGTDKEILKYNERHIPAENAEYVQKAVNKLEKRLELK